MKKIWFISLLLVGLTFISSCEGIDVSKVSDEDLGRLAEKAIVCNEPYIRFGTSCCLDQNDNSICDNDEKIIEVIEKVDGELIELGKNSLPSTVSTNDFLATLTAHDEMRAFVGVAPLNIIQIDNNNIANLQTQINGLDTSFIGDFLIQYTNSIVIYDLDNDLIKGTVSLKQSQQAALPADFYSKLNAHPEIAGLETEQPVGGPIDAVSLATLKQQFPDVYENAKVGDFLLRYTTKLIIYDYNADVIVNALSLSE